MRILDIFHNVSYLINSSLVEVNQATYILLGCLNEAGMMNKE